MPIYLYHYILNKNYSIKISAMPLLEAAHPLSIPLGDFTFLLLQLSQTFLFLFSYPLPQL